MDKKERGGKGRKGGRELARRADGFVEGVGSSL